MRVAGRRVRAGWRVFGSAFDPEARRRYRDDLRAIGGHLGMVRDMDVRIGILDAYAGERSHRQRGALEPIRAAWLAHAMGLGGEIRVQLPERELTGRFASLDPNGRLLLRLPSGETELVLAGDVFGLAPALGGAA